MCLTFPSAGHFVGTAEPADDAAHNVARELVGLRDHGAEAPGEEADARVVPELREQVDQVDELEVARDLSLVAAHLYFSRL